MNEFVDIAAVPFRVRVEQQAEIERIRREARRLVDAEEQPPAPLPAARTLADLLQEPAAPVMYRIDGWLPTEARALLAAQFKAGKTTLVGNLLRSFVDGSPFLGEARTQAYTGTVALLDTEMAPGQLRRWLGDQRIVNAQRIVVCSLRGRVSSFDLRDAERRQAWAALLRRHGAQCVVLDCLRPILDALGLDESREAGRFLVAFDALLREAGILEAVVVHHMGHTGERARGDSRLRDWPDVEWRLVRQEDAPHSPRFITAFGRDVDVRECALAYDAPTRRLTLSGGSRADHRTSAALEAVVDFLRTSATAQSGRAIFAAFAEDDTHSRQAIREALALGIREGLIDTYPGPRRATLHTLRGVQ